ncbi:MAG: MBL fold metallo-hydrolase [Clostridia bacterium]|nr:MBL fold metallo-hydrolase [Clostridia bacterium]
MNNNPIFELIRKLRYKINNNKALKIILSLVLICLIVYEIHSMGGLEQFMSSFTGQQQTTTSSTLTTVATEPTEAPKPKELVITMLDVDQGDSILISYDDHHMLIDTNVTEYYANVKNTLTKLGVKKLDYLIATHPHADHIGSMHKVLEDFKVGTYYYTDCDTGKYTLENAMKMAHKNANKVELIAKGDKFKLGKDVKFTVLSPVEGYDSENINNYSSVLLLEWGEFNALFTGDAESDIELELVKNNLVPDVDLLKLGHHGSYTSSHRDFLKASNPEVTLISLGKDNEYGYPHQVTLNKLEDIKTKVYRTDLRGNITVTVDEDGKMKVK